MFVQKRHIWTIFTQKYASMQIWLVILCSLYSLCFAYNPFLPWVWKMDAWRDGLSQCSYHKILCLFASSCPKIGGMKMRLFNIIHTTRVFSPSWRDSTFIEHINTRQCRNFSYFWLELEHAILRSYPMLYPEARWDASAVGHIFVVPTRCCIWMPGKKGCVNSEKWTTV